MGHSIVYCDKCGQLLREEEFRQGRASTADNRSYCATCRPTGSPKTPLPSSLSKVSSTRIPKQPAHESRRMMAVPPAPPPPPPPPSKSGGPVLYIGIAGAVILVFGIFAMMSGGQKEPRRTEEQTQTVVAVPVRPTESLPPEDRRREEAARAACVKAYGIRSSRPQDLAAQWRAFEEAVAASQGTSYSGDATSQLAGVRRKLDEERTIIDGPVQTLAAKEQFKAALEVWEKERKRYDVAEWTQPAATRIAELKNDFERRLGIQREAAVEAKRRGDEGEAKKIRGRVAAWGLSGYAEQIDQALAEVTVVKTDPAPDPGAGVSKAIEEYRSRWKAMLASSAARDYAEAVKAMEKLAAEAKDAAVKKESAEDLDNLRLAGSVIQEAAPLLPKMARGQKISLSYWDPLGAPARVEDLLLRIDAQRVEVKSGEGSVVLPFGEIAAGTLAELFKSHAARKESDGRAAALACLLEGDPEGAQRVRGDPAPAIPDRYAEAAKEIAAARMSDDKEKAARSLFYDAEREYFDPGSTAGSVAKYKALLAEHAGTAFVRRNRAAIAARTEAGPRDLLFTSGDLLATSGFKMGKHGKIEAAWVSQADLELPRMKENFVEFEFAAGPDAEYRCWILAGGCCQEVFTCYAQATELMGPDPSNPKEKIALEPGSAAGLPAKLPSLSLKKLHSQHNGPKNPERFEWIQLATLKFPTAGTKKVRILSNQKGFGVAAAAVLLTRPGPPKDSDFKELEKWKAETPGATASKANTPAGSILREMWRNIGNGGAVSDLVNNPAYKEDRPTESGLLTIFEGPTDVADEYGSRIRGYVHPPVSGAYVFFIASDDQGELWLSSDEDPTHVKKIAWLGEWSGRREYTKSPSQQSAPVELKAGRRYYIQALHKEGIGGDHLSVGWTLPGGLEEKPIPGNRLSPFIVPKK
jgi:hypothetical protein